MSFDLDKINHPKVKFGKTGVCWLSLAHQTQRIGGILENI